MIELARAVGNMYSAVNDGIGDANTPGTAIFEVAQLKSLASNGLPMFGVVSDTTNTFTPSYDPNNPYYVSFISGYVGYNGSLIVVPGQQVAIKKQFGISYGSGYQYLVRVGFPLSEAQKTTQTWSSVVSATAPQYSTSITIANPSIPVNLGFPILAQVGNILVQFSGLTADGTGLQIDPGFNNGLVGSHQYGQLAQQATQGTMVYFIYTPILHSICSIPVNTSVSSVGNFEYVPPLPNDWLPIADILCSNPNNPSVVETTTSPSIVYAINVTTQPWPAPNSSTPLFGTSDANAVVRVCARTQAALQQLGATTTVSDLIAVIEQFTQVVSDEPGQTFNQVWASQPFAASSYFTRGVGFRGLSRPEFTDEFAQAYYALRNADVQHTFAIFRGDLYNAGVDDVGSPPSSVASTYGLTSWLVNQPSTPTLSRGSYTYGVTAVFASGETAPAYTSVTTTWSTPNLFFTNIQFEEVSGAYYYHVYRQSNTVGDLHEYRLTEPYQQTGGGVYSKPTLAYAGGVELTNCAAFKFTAPSASSFLNSVGLQMYTDGTLTDPTATITVSIFADTSGSPAGSSGPVANSVSQQITFSQLNNSYQHFVFQVNASLTPLSNYWVVVETSTPPTGAHIYLSIDSTTGTNLVKTAPTLTSSWTSSSNSTGNADLYFGFIDYGTTQTLTASRGVCLTGNIAQTPRRLRVYVPSVSATATRGLSPTYTPPTTPLAETQNEMVVTVVAQNGANGTPVTFTTTIPQFSQPGYSVILGTISQLFDRVISVQVIPGASANLTVGSGGSIMWSFYDFVTVETVP